MATSDSTLRVRLDGIRNILIAHWKAGAALPSATKGVEREVLVREFLAKVFPPPFRFGSGAVADGEGRTSGQLDIVVEFPFLPSFPTPGAADRLYLADSTALVIEVKSDLSGRWEQVLSSAGKVLPLRRKWLSHSAVDAAGKSETFPSSISRVPFLAVGYRGPKETETLMKWIGDAASDRRPDGILVIETGTYSGCCFNDWRSGSVGAAGLFGFCADVAWLARNVTWSTPDLGEYFSQLAESLG
jgi:hypothetical protein